MINLQTIISFTRQFSSLLDTGLTVTESLDTLSSEEENKKFRNILITIKEDMEVNL